MIVSGTFWSVKVLSEFCIKPRAVGYGTCTDDHRDKALIKIPAIMGSLGISFVPGTIQYPQI